MNRYKVIFCSNLSTVITFEFFNVEMSSSDVRLHITLLSE